MKPKILIASKIHDKALALAAEFADYDVKAGLSEEELVGVIGDYDAIIVRSKPNVSRAIIEAGKKLKVIGRAGVGLDNIDKDAANERKIPIVNSPEASTISVAEQAIGLMLALYRDTVNAHNSTSEGNWDRKNFIGNELFGKTLGIIGFGRIGREVAKRARVFGLEILICDPIITSEDAREFNGKCVNMEDLFSQADIITLHVPAIEATRDIVSKSTLALMKPTAILVNTSRGHAIDEDALYQVLKDGKIRGAALDVYKTEPPVGSPLFDLPNIITVCHLGANTEEAQINAGTVVVEKVRQIIAP